MPCHWADEPIDLKVPGTLKEYVYTRDGIHLQDQEARLILYEPAPMHSGFRLAIRLNDPVAFQPLIMQVIPVPESFFPAAPARGGRCVRVGGGGISTTRPRRRRQQAPLGRRHNPTSAAETAESGKNRQSLFHDETRHAHATAVKIGQPRAGM